MVKTAVRTVCAVFLLLSAVFVSHSAPICGRTYSIAEPDLLMEAERRAEAVMNNRAYMEKLRKKLKREALSYRPPYLQYLPPSRKSFSYKFDVIYTLPFDIPRVDLKTGKVTGVLYPKGFTFHVMRYISYFPPLVVFDIKNTPERKWVVRRFSDNYTVMLLSVSGSTGEILKLVRKIRRPVYFDVDLLNRRLNIKHTVSIVTRDRDNPDLVDIRVVGLDDIKKELEVADAEKAAADKRDQRTQRR